MPDTYIQVSRPGIQGIQGPPGVGYNPRGPYTATPSPAYAQGDMVSYSGLNYIALQASTGIVPTNTTYWESTGGVPGYSPAWLSGTGAPTTQGNNGDWYLDTATGNCYGPKASGTWPGIVVNIKGPTGATGLSFGGASSTSITPAIANKSFTTSMGLAWAAGMPIQATSASTPATYMAGTVYGYSGTSLVITVTSCNGSAKSDWVFSAPTGAQGLIGPAGASYMSSLFTGPDMSQTISGATHGMATPALSVVCYDNASPLRNEIEVGIQVNPTTYDVVVTFATAQTNYYITVISGAYSAPTSTFPSGTGMVKVTSGVPSLASSSTDYQTPIGYMPENYASKGQPLGYCPLDSGALVPMINLPPGIGSGYNPSTFNFASISPSGSLVSGTAFTLPGYCPQGVNLGGVDTGHYLYINDLTTPANSEPALIVSGSARSGVLGGTLTLTCAHSHTGSWTITSASQGIQEAVIVACLGAPYWGWVENLGAWINLTGRYAVYAPVYVPGICWFNGGVIQMYGATLVAFDFNSQSNRSVNGIFQNMTFWGNNGGAGGAPQSSGSCAIRLGNSQVGGGVQLQNCVFKDQYDDVVGVNSTNIRSTWNYHLDFLHTGYTIGGTGDTGGLCSNTDFFLNGGLASPALACFHLLSGANTILNPQCGMNDSTQLQYGVLGVWSSSSSALTIVGGGFAYFSTAGISLSTSGTNIEYQYVAITGVQIHNEDYSAASKGIVFGTASGSYPISQVSISGCVIQGNGANFIGIDVTGVPVPTLGSNDISFASGTPGVRIAGYAGPTAYANNAAALAAGLSVGEVYRISGTDTMGIVH